MPNHSCELERNGLGRSSFPRAQLSKRKSATIHRQWEEENEEGNHNNYICVYLILIIHILLRKQQEISAVHGSVNDNEVLPSTPMCMHGRVQTVNMLKVNATDCGVNVTDCGLNHTPFSIVASVHNIEGVGGTSILGVLPSKEM